MKIIRHGNTYHEIVCSKCKAQFGYTNKEVVIDNDESPFGEDWSKTTYIKCPECEYYIILKQIINGKVINNGDDIFRINTGENMPKGLC